MQVDDRATAIEVPNSHEVVSSKKNFFVHNRSTWSDDVQPVQDNVNISKVLNTAMGFLKAKNIGLFSNSFEILRFIFAWLAGSGRTQWTTSVPSAKCVVPSPEGGGTRERQPPAQGERTVSKGELSHRLVLRKISSELNTLPGQRIGS